MNRPERNKNPGDLRTLPESLGTWAGQIAVDTAPGGPFAIFGNERDGWHALAQCLLAYQELHGIRTIRKAITRYAPGFENDTTGYIEHVAQGAGVDADATIDFHEPKFLQAVMTAIGNFEGGKGWDPTMLKYGLEDALRLHHQPNEEHGAYQQPNTVKEITAEDLNAAQLIKLHERE